MSITVHITDFMLSVFLFWYDHREHQEMCRSAQYHHYSEPLPFVLKLADLDWLEELPSARARTSVLARGSGVNHRQIGTCIYAAPEVSRDGLALHPKRDVWSLGMTLCVHGILFSAGYMNHKRCSATVLRAHSPFVWTEQGISNSSGQPLSATSTHSRSYTPRNVITGWRAFSDEEIRCVLLRFCALSPSASD